MACVAVGLVLGTTPGVLAAPDSRTAARDVAAAQAHLDRIDEQRGHVLERYNAAQVALDEVNGRLEAHRAQLDALEATAEELSGSLATHARRLHMLGPAIELSAVVLVGGAEEVTARATAIRQVLGRQQIDVEALTAIRVSAMATHERIDLEQAAAERQAEEFAARREEITAVFAETEAQVARLQSVLVDTRRREAAEAAEARRLDAERAARRAAERAAATAPVAAPVSAPAPTATPAPTVRRSASVAVEVALAQLGKPYRWGGSGPGAFDCSGLTSFAWRAAGVHLPRTSGAQYAATRRISRDELQPGDLVFYHRPISHVAMYIGGGRVVEAPNSGNSVRIRNDGLTRRGVVGFGRP